MKDRPNSQGSGRGQRLDTGRDSRLLYVLLAMVLVQLLISLLPINKKFPSFSVVASNETNCASVNPAKTETKPWGDLEFETIMLEVPDDYLSDNRLPVDKLDWYLASDSQKTFLNGLSSFDLSDEQRAALRDVSKWRTATNGSYFSPSRDFLLGMSGRARQQIYPRLAEFPENLYQSIPFSFPASREDQWFANSGLYAETLSVLKRLLYKRGDSLCFSDMGVFGNLPLDEYRRLLKSLAKIPAVIMRLRVSQKSDVGALINYWGTKGTTHRIKPLLESLAKAPGESTVDVANLLPWFAQSRLYSFPDRSDERTWTAQNCYWTALNFFKDKPDDRFTDPQYTADVIRKEYFRVQSAPALGDLITVVDSRDVFLHCSLYVADDVVFTKDGGHFLQPWILMRIPDMVARYSSEEPVRVVIFRAKSQVH